MWIDVSSNNDVYDFEAAKRGGVSGAIIRTIVKKGTVDPKADRYFKAALAAGIGAEGYKFSYALTRGEEKAAFERVIAFLRTVDIDPAETCIWGDYEWKTQREKLTRQEITDLVKTAQEVVLNAGYKYGTYCNYDWYNNVLLPDQISCPWWIARYPKKDTGVIRESLRPNVGEEIWQYSSKGAVDGIRGNVDLNDRKEKVPAGEPGVIYTVSIADVWTRDRAEELQRQYAAMNIHGKVHKVQILE